MPETGSVSGAEPVERSTMYPEGPPPAAVHDVVMVVAVTAECVNAVGCATGNDANVVALAMGADVVR